MTYSELNRKFIFILIGFALLISFFSINFISAGTIVYDDPSVPHTSIPSTGGITNINNSYTNISNTYVNQTLNITNNITDSKWTETTNIAGDITLHPINLSQNVGIGTNNSAYDLEVRNTDGVDIDGDNSNNTWLAISSGAGNDNATLLYREGTAVRYKIMYDGFLSIFQIYSFALGQPVLSFSNGGRNAEFSQNVSILGDLTAPNICYKNGTNCNTTVGSTYNSSYVPYTGATTNVNLGEHNLTLNGTIYFPEGYPGTNGIKPILQINPVNMDAFTLEYNYDFEAANDDWIVFKKTDGNDANPDGGFAFVMVNASGYNKTKIKIDGYDLVNFTNQNIITTGNLTVAGLRTSGQVFINDTGGHVVNLGNLITHLEDLSTDTLLDYSRSTLSVVGGQLNYTLFAVDGTGEWNFNRTVYAGPGVSVANVTVTLTCGTDIAPVTNYIYWELVGGVPTMLASSVYPTSVNHIDTATFVVGACAGTTANIYSYSRNRYEVDSFIKRVIQRFEESGTLYVSGFVPSVNLTRINITSGGVFFNGIFEMTSTNFIDGSSFYWINSTGNFVQATSLASINQYQGGTSFAGNDRMNVVWGLVPINTTGGVGPTQMRLVAVPQSDPGGARQYISAITAEQDQYGVTNYYPSNTEVKNVFVPIARTIIRASTSQFETFATGSYYKDIRGKITSGGGAATSTPTYWGLTGNQLSTTTGTYQVKVNELLINNTNYLYNAVSAHGNINSYYQFNVWNHNMSSLASSDLVATSPIGSETEYFVDVGITSPSYADPVYGPATPANTSYLIAQNTSLNIGTGASGKMISFFVNSFTLPIWIMNMTSTKIDIFKNTYIYGNLSVTGNTTLTQGNLKVDNYTQLGSDAPKIKIKKLTGTTGANEGDWATIAHGLTSTKIISCVVLVSYDSGRFVPISLPATGIAGYEFTYYIDTTNVYVGLEATNSENIKSKPISIVITYEE